MTPSIDERASLLPKPSKPFDRHVRPLLTRAQSSVNNINIPQTHSPRLVLCLTTFLIFTVMFGMYCMIIPSARIYEDIICHNYYDRLLEKEGHISMIQDIPENLCKGNEVQEELAFVVGIKDSIQCIPGILFAYPYGRLSDKWGRKKVFGLAAFGLVISELYILLIVWFWRLFPLRLIWASALFLCVGGGSGVIQNMLYATLSDVSTDETRATNFFTVSTGVLLAEVVAPTIAAYLMRFSPWIPVFIGFVLLMLGFCVMIFIPETLKARTDHGHITQNSLFVSIHDGSVSQEDSGLGMSSKIVSVIPSKFRAFQEDLLLFKSTTLIVLLISFVIHPLILVLGTFFPRYVSRRFNWSLADSGYTMSYKAVINIFLLLVILPAVSYMLSRTSKDTSKWYARFELGLSTRSKDLVLARGSLFFLIAGAFLLGSSATIYSAIFALTLWTLGTGFSSACRSLITMLVNQEYVGRLYAIVSLVEVFGMLTASPLMATLYSWGLERAEKNGSDVWMGSPFYGIMIICGLCGSGIWFITLPQEDEMVHDTDNRPAFSAP